MLSRLSDSSALRAALAAVAAALLYLNALPNRFAYDDTVLIVDNPFVHDATLRGAWRLFTSFDAIEDLPLRDLTYLADYAVWGLNPLGFHLTNIALYVLCVLAVYALTAALVPLLGQGGDTRCVRWLPLLAALLFAAHPVHSEAVAISSGRKDILAGLLFFIAAERLARFELSDRRHFGLFAASTISFVLAFLAKSSVMVMPGVVLLLLAAHTREHRPRRSAGSAALVAPFIAITAVFLWLNAAIAAREGVAAPLDWRSLPRHGWTAVAAFEQYLRILFLPYRLRAHYRFSYLDFDWTVAASGAVIIALVAAAVISFRRRQPIPLFGLAWFAVTVAPFLGLIRTNIIIADRYLFLPSYGAALVAALGLVRLAVRPRLAVTLSATVMVALGAYTLQRNTVFYDDIALFSDAMQKDPDDPVATEGLARALWTADRKTEALARVRTFEDRNPLALVYEKFTGIYFLEQGNLDQAQTWLLQAEQKAPFNLTKDLYLRLGQLYERRGDFERALRYYLKQRDDSPRAGPPETAAWHDPIGTAALAGVRRMRERFTAPLAAAQQSMQAHDSLETRFQLAYQYDVLGLYAEALSAYRRALELDPKQPVIQINLGKIYRKQRSYHNAIEAFGRALDLGAPDPAAVSIEIGSCYVIAGDPAAAEAAFRDAAARDPSAPLPYAHLANLYADAHRPEAAIGAIREMQRRAHDPWMARVAEAAAARLATGGRRP